MIWTRRAFLAGSAGISLASVLYRPSQAGQSMQLRIAVLKFGTVNWELETIHTNGFDAKHGVEMIPYGVASSAAAKIAFEGGQADMLVADWIWVARQRAAGRDFVFAPYSQAVGGIMVREDGPIATLEDLKGKRIGVGGGPLDKSWLIFQAYAAEHGIDLARDAEPVFGAPPLIMRKGLSGELDAVLNYWHFAAKMKPAGFRSLIDIQSAAHALGITDEIPLLGYVFRESCARENPELIEGFLAASAEAKAMLVRSDAAWDDLRPKMNAASDAEFIALRGEFRAGIPSGNVDPAAAETLFEILARRGGSALVGDAKTLPDGVFYGAE